MRDLERLPKFELICGTDDLRPTMTHVFLNRENFVATDSHLMTWGDTPEFFDEDFIKEIPEDGVLIHGEDWKKMSKCAFFTWKKGLIEINYAKKRKTFIEPETQENVGKYPNWKGVIPSDDGEAKNFIGVDPDLLVKLGKALNFDHSNNHLKLSFHSGLRAITAEPIGAPKKLKGLIMPVKVD